MLIGFPADVATDAEFSKRSVCGVIATAIVSGKSFNECYAYYQEMKRYNWKGALYLSEIISGMSHFGARLVKENFSKSNFTNGTFAEYTGKTSPNDVFVVFNNNHVVTVHNGKIMDQGGIHNAHGGWCKGKQVIGVYRVTNAATIDYSNTVKDVKPDWVSPRRIERQIAKLERQFNITTTVKPKVVMTGKIARVTVFVQNQMAIGTHKNVIVQQIVEQFGVAANTANMYYYKAMKALA